MEFINYTTHLAENYWQRHSFLHKWWTLYSSDRRWSPFLYRNLYRELVKLKSPYIIQQNSFFLSLEALPRSPNRESDVHNTFSTALFDQQIASTVGMCAPERNDGTAYAALLHCVNHEESMARLYGATLEKIAECERFRLVAPIALAPHDPRTGVLCDHFDRLPPLHTPYNPPYVPELFELVMTPLLDMRLYRAAVKPQKSKPNNEVEVVTIEPQRLSNDLLPLFQSAYLDHPEFAPPDALESAYLLASWNIAPLYALGAMIESRPVGFVLLQSDIGEAICRARGGRNLFWRIWLHWRAQRPARAGRVLSATVLPEWRYRGIGRQLWQAAIDFANGQGWQNLTVGPVIENSEGATFLEAMGAIAEQRYRLYSSEE